MAVVFRRVFSVNLTKSFGLPRTPLSNFNDRSSFLLTMAGHRLMSKFIITPNIKLNSLSPVTFNAKPNSLPLLEASSSRPLVVLLEYLNAKERHIKRFIDFYAEYGFDVLQVHLKPWQLLWPTKGSQIVAKDVAEFLTINKSFSPMIIHGFSVGGYLWGEILLHFSRNLACYQEVAERIKCKIFDSAVDVEEIPKGFPEALFPKNTVLKATFEKYLRYHLRTFYEESTRHYIAARKQFGGGLVKCPTLLLTSDSDPLSTVAVNEKVRQELSALNLEMHFWYRNHLSDAFVDQMRDIIRKPSREPIPQCYVKVFERSTHVAHFKKHKSEYIAEIETLLAKVNIFQQQMVKAKL